MSVVIGVNDPESVKASLVAVRELLADKSRHTTRVYARNERGAHVDAESSRAVCWCLVGAVRKVTDYKKRQYHYNWVLNALFKASGYEGIYELNDQPKSHKKVLKLLDKAIAEVSCASSQ